MAYQDKYLRYLEAVPEISDRCYETGVRPVLAYTSNLDAIVEWDAESFNRLLDRCLKEEPSFREEETVKTMEDFARIASWFAVNGYGGEVEITSGEVIDQLKDYFKIQYGLGGTCAQGAAALAELGVPVLVHLTDLSREVAGWMDYTEVESVKGKNRVPLKECCTEEKPLIHLIMQFNKGDVIKAGGKEYTVPLSNRLIMDYDQVHKILPVRKEFLDYVEDHAEMICSYDISGFNAIVEAAVLEERLAELKKHYQIIKKKNPKMIIYLESAHFISADIRNHLYSSLSDSIDIMGMNEEELADLSKRMDHPVNVDDISSVAEGLDRVLERYPVKGIVMHSKDYALYYGEEMPGTDLEMGLTLGCLMSGTRARIGRYGSREDCRESLELRLSPAGMAFAEKISKLELPHTAVLVPSRYMEKPKYTIGLGDTFVAGMQMCFVR